MLVIKLTNPSNGPAMIRFQGIDWRKNSKQLIITLPYLVKNVLQEESCADQPMKVKFLKVSKIMRSKVNSRYLDKNQKNFFISFIHHLGKVPLNKKKKR